MTILLCNISFAQNIPDDANTIIIKMDSTVTPEAAFKKFGKILIKHNYTLEQIDKTFLMLTTKTRELKFGGFFSSGTALIKIIAEVIENPTRLKLKLYFMRPDIYKAFDVKVTFEDKAMIADYGDDTFFGVIDKLAKEFSPKESISYIIEKEKDD